MSVAELRRVVAAGDEQEARRAIRACGERLRAGTEAERAGLAREIELLGRHTSAIVRLAVADVCDAFPAASAFEETHALLLADPDRFVRAAAEAAGHRRAQQRRHKEKSGNDERVLAELLAEIGEVYEPEARRLAERAVERGVEHFAVQVDHEVRKTQAPIALALMRLLAEAERPERNLRLVGEHAGMLRERIAFVFSMVRRAREYAATIKASFVEESLAGIVEEARAQLVGRLGPRSAKLAFTAEVDGALRAEVDRFALLQALQNLVQNAAEAYPEEAERLVVRVSAEARRGGSEFELHVADDGVGIRKDLIDGLFVPFGSQKPGGTGVGLAIARRMVKEVHGGDLTIESAPGKGTTVTIVIPTKQGKR